MPSDRSALSRRRSLLLLVTIVALGALAWLGPGPARSATDGPRAIPAPDGPTTFDSETVYIRLRGDPVLVAWRQASVHGDLAAASVSARAQAATLAEAQADLEPRIEALGGRVIYRLQRIGNAIVAEIPAGALPAVRALPGVASVEPMPLARPENAVSVPLIGAPAVWGGAGGPPVRGEGVTIGIVDTGVDYLHTGFGGSGLAADYDRNDTTIITDGVGFPNKKVAGGYDFAGDAYDAVSANPAARLPRPDPDPIDCRAAGHGTHVAGTAAGYGVNADGTTYAGPWDAGSVPTDTMKIGPGVAPLATIYALRVFGCANGASVLYAQAIEWATDPNGDFDFSDHLDVVNLSFGIDVGGRGEDPVEQAINNAALAGVVVVAAAGNDGDTFFSVNSPAYADRAIAVAASNDPNLTVPTLRIAGSGPAAGSLGILPAAGGGTISATLVVTGQIVRVGSAVACQTTATPGLLAGRIALIDRGPACSDSDRARSAQRAGAAGVVLANETDGETAGLAVASSITVPVGLVERVVGERIKTALQFGPIEATIDGGARFSGTDTMASFSARGPRRADGALKPDLSAPGTSVVSAKAWSGSGAQPLGGTSMASPHVAGAVALLRQLHPDWSVEELKALALNTALPAVRTIAGIPYSPSRQGAGRIDLAAAAASPVVAFAGDDSGRVSLSFGLPRVITPTTVTRPLRIVNKGPAPATYTLGVSEVVTVSGVSLVVTVSGVSLIPLSGTIAVPAGGAVTVPIQLAIDPGRIDRTLDRATPDKTFEGDRQYLDEHAGYVTLTGPNVLQVPYHVAPRPATALRSAGPLSFGADGSIARVAITGTGIATGSMAQPLVWTLELQEVSPLGSLRPVNSLQEMGDLRYVGVGSDVAPGLPVRDTTWIYFGLAAYAPWTTPGGLDTVFEVEIDTNRDGAPDYVVRNESGPRLSDGSLGLPSDVFVAASYAISGTARVPVGRAPLNAFPVSVDTAPYSSTVLVLPIRAGDLGLPRNGTTRFDYRVKTYLYQFQAFGERRALFDVSARHSFDPAEPALRAGSGTAPGALPGSPWAPVWRDVPGAAIPVAVDRLAWPLDRPLGLLLIHHFNEAAAQAEAVTVDAGIPAELPAVYLPLAGRDGG